jgi:hypothetical protein
VRRERNFTNHAIEYAKAMRKRLGYEGEKKWIDSDRERMRAAYQASRPEVGQLLVYYAMGEVCDIEACC